jgi:hypothetical protein
MHGGPPPQQRPPHQRYLAGCHLQRGELLVGDRPGAGPRHVTQLGDPVLDETRPPAAHRMRPMVRLLLAEGGGAPLV